MTVATRKLLQNSCDGPTMRFVSTKNDEQLNIQGYTVCAIAGSREERPDESDTRISPGTWVAI